jgi:hypothetical protein
MVDRTLQRVLQRAADWNNAVRCVLSTRPFPAGKHA